MWTPSILQGMTVKKSRLYGAKSLFYELKRRKARVRTRNCDCTRSQAVSAVADVSRTPGDFFHVHEWSWPPNIMRLAMSFVSCPSQVTFVINELVFFIITCSEHHSSKWTCRRYTHVYAIETLPVFILANINYMLHSYFLHKGDINYIFLEILHQYSCTGAWNGAYNSVVPLLVFRFV